MLPALGRPEGDFVRAMQENADRQNDIIIEAHPEAAALLWWSKGWTDNERVTNASALLDILGNQVSAETKKSKSWPKTTKDFSTSLRRLKPNLLSAGLSVEFIRTAKERTIRLERRTPETIVEDASFASRASSEGDPPGANDANDAQFGRDGRVTDFPGEPGEGSVDGSMSDPADLRTSPKKSRKPNATTQMLWDAIGSIAHEYDRMSVRQLFYQLVSRGVIPKTESAYKRVCDASAQMRLAGALSYRKIADGHRTRREVFAHDGLNDALESAQELYRRNYWLNQPDHIEVWSEKDALTGVIEPVCRQFGVTYVATRGYPSITLRNESAEAIKDVGKPATIFYFGDHDASGQNISDNLEGELRQHGADATVQRVALWHAHIGMYNLPTRPGKRTDSRHEAFAAKYGDASVELDALPPNVLTEAVRNAIISMIYVDQWRRAKAIEQLEKETLASIVRIPWEAGQEYVLPDPEAA